MLGTLVVRCQTRGKFPVYTVAFMPFERVKGDPTEMSFEGDLAVLKALENFVTAPTRLLEAIKRLRDEGLAYIPDVALSRAQMSRFGLAHAMSGPKCARCSRPVMDDPIINAEDVFHTHCWQVLSSQAQIVESGKRIRKSKDVIEKTRAMFEQSNPTFLADRVCRVCLNVIQPSDPLSRRGAILIHAQCDYTTQPARDPDSPAATPPLPMDRDTE